MPSISCDVYHCFHNKEGGCKLTYLKIEGDGADYPDETICDSYTDRASPHMGAFSEGNEPSEFADVDCTAENCKYNSDHVCMADRISVGDPGARRSFDTECETFDPKDPV